MFILQIIESLGAAGAAAFVLSIVVAITVHEFAHAWTANRLGDDTPYLMGRVNLNPASHIDPIGGILFLIIGFGWGRPVLYNPMRLARKVDELLIALAGPASNIILAIFFNLVALIVQVTGFTYLNIDFLLLASYINIALAAFNMIPIPPLDGSSIVAYFWPEYRSVLGGQLGFVIVLALLFLSVGGSSLLSYIMRPLLNSFATITSLFGALPNPLNALF